MAEQKKKLGKDKTRDTIIAWIKEGLHKKDIIDKICSILQYKERAAYYQYDKAYAIFLEHKKQLELKLFEKEVEVQAEVMRANIMSNIQRKEWLTQTILGQVEHEVKRVVWHPVNQKFEVVTLKSQVSLGEKLRALNELNRMSGDHVPHKLAYIMDTEVEKGELDYEVLPDEIIDQIIAAKKQKLEEDNK
jgi:hypothetical protein